MGAGDGMKGFFSLPTVAQRSGLFGVVVGAHAVLLGVLSSARTAGPAVEERTIVVDVLPMAAGGAQEEPPVRQVAAPLPRALPGRPRAPSANRAAAPAEKSVVPEAAAKPVPGPDAPAYADGRAPAVDESAGRSGGGAPGAGNAGKGQSATDDATAEARFDAEYLRNPAPPYPAISRRMGEEGKVVLRVLVTPEGTAGNLEIRTSSGSPRLDESASRTVRQWKFVPARRGDSTVQSWVLVPVVFKLES